MSSFRNSPSFWVHRHNRGRSARIGASAGPIHGGGTRRTWSGPVASAAQVAEAPVVDGALDERVWQDAPPLTISCRPSRSKGSRPRERTEVRILYDDEAIYVGVVLHDTRSVADRHDRHAPRRGAGRDGLVPDDLRHLPRSAERVRVRHQRRRACSTTRRCATRASQATSWDGSWDVQTNVDGNGLDGRVPDSAAHAALRPAPQTWGINFFRNIQRTRERDLLGAAAARTTTSAGCRRRASCAASSSQTPRNFKVLPYVVGSAEPELHAPGSETDFDGDFGFDAKFGVTPSLNLDLTYNTDFAQVEVDTQQINLTRFNLRFPGEAAVLPGELGPVHASARARSSICSSAAASASTTTGCSCRFRGGGRLTGKVNGFNVGVLNMQTDDVGLTSGQQLLGAARRAASCANRSGVGAMFVNRTATGRPAGVGRLEPHVGRRRAARRRRALHDVRLRGAHRDAGPARARLRLQRRLASTTTAGIAPDSSTGVTGEDFNPEVGFLENEDGYRRFFVGFRRRCGRRRFGTGDFASCSRTSITRGTTTSTAGCSNAELHVDNHWDWENGQFIDTRAQRHAGKGSASRSRCIRASSFRPASTAACGSRLVANTDRRKWVFAPSAVGRRPFPDRRAEQPDRPGDPAGWRPVHARHDVDLPRRSRCRRERSTPISATCASPTTSRHRCSCRAWFSTTTAPTDGRRTCASTGSRPPAPVCSSSTTTPRA